MRGWGLASVGGGGVPTMSEKAGIKFLDEGSIHGIRTSAKGLSVADTGEN